jgi:glycosyltransferase involved in cell wall biosynthesis
LPAFRVPLTIVIPTLNEVDALSTGLPDLRWADEVIVADGGSSDGTREMAVRLGARVLLIEGQTIAAQRNAAIAVARNRWILALDADEQVSPELRDELRALTMSGEMRPAVYRVRSRNWHLGGELRHGPWGRDWKLRVFTRENRFDDKRVHEQLEVKGEIGALQGTLIHYPYRDLPHQVSKIATYASWATEDLHDRNKRASVWALLVRPPFRFFRDYVLMSGWRDGMRGFIVAAVSAFSVFLKYASLMTRPPAVRVARQTVSSARAG